MPNAKASKTQIKSQLLRVTALEIELQECDTQAKHVCVYRALDNATRELRAMKGQVF